MKSVSLQCWKLKKLEFGRHLRPCVRKSLVCWCRGFCKPIDGHQCSWFRHVVFPTICSNAARICQEVQWQGFLLTSLVLRFPRQMSPTVAMPKFLSDWCEGFIHHPAVLAKSFIFTCQYGKTEVSQNDQGKITSLVKICSTVPNEGHQCRCQPLTTVTQRFSPQFPSSSKVRSMSSVSSQCWWLQKLEPGRHLRPCVRKILGCWCCCVTTARQPLWLRLRFAARMSKACCNASIHNRSMTFSYIFHSFRFLLSFKRHFSYERVNGSCWIQVAGSCSSLLAFAAPRKVSSILVTSSEWWSRLNEIKEAYRMEWHLSGLFTFHRQTKLLLGSLRLQLAWNSSLGSSEMQVEVVYISIYIYIYIYIHIHI